MRIAAMIHLLGDGLEGNQNGQKYLACRGRCSIPSTASYPSPATTSALEVDGPRGSRLQR